MSEDAKAPPLDGEFWNNYRAIWGATFGRLHVPLPDDVFKAILGLWGGHETLLKALEVAPGESTKLWWKTKPPLSLRTARGIAAMRELRALLLGAVGPAYAGALLGTAVVAAYETWGNDASAKLSPWVSEMERSMNRSFDSILGELLGPVAGSSSKMREAMFRARSLSSAQLRT